MNEIQERADWLAEMEALGEAKEHRPVILAQIAERLRRVKQLERRRHDGLAAMRPPVPGANAPSMPPMSDSRAQ